MNDDERRTDKLRAPEIIAAEIIAAEIIENLEAALAQFVEISLSLERLDGA